MKHIFVGNIDRTLVIAVKRRGLLGRPTRTIWLKTCGPSCLANWFSTINLLLFAADHFHNLSIFNFGKLMWIVESFQNFGFSSSSSNFRKIYLWNFGIFLETYLGKSCRRYVKIGKIRTSLLNKCQSTGRPVVSCLFVHRHNQGSIPGCLELGTWVACV